MSMPLGNAAMRTTSLNICRRCLSMQSREALATRMPKREMHSASLTSQSTPRLQSIMRHEQSLRQGMRSQLSAPPRRGYKTVQQAKDRAKLGPFSWQAGVLFLFAGVGLTIYFRYEKARMARARIAEANKGIGKPLIGGPFHLTTTSGADFTDENIKGKYSLIYFGFTHCPDICPEELDKMAGMIDLVKAKHGNVLRPLFISCDPARDTPEVIEKYLVEFHPDIVGMTGSWQEVKDVCKAYRVYFSTPPDVKPGQDYLVDHSIYFYLMDPDGDFVEAIGRNFTMDAAAKVINDHVGDWKGKLDKS